MSATLEVLEPATEAVLAEIPRAGAEEADAAVARAKAAFPAWRAVAPSDRSALLHRLPAAPEGGEGGLARARRRARGRAGGARAARGAQRRQADRGRARRDGNGGRDLPLLRRGPGTVARRHDPGGRRRRDDVPRAARRRRADHALELPAHDRVLEARAGAG